MPGARNCACKPRFAHEAVQAGNEAVALVCERGNTACVAPRAAMALGRYPDRDDAIEASSRQIDGAEAARADDPGCRKITEARAGRQRVGKRVGGFSHWR